MQTKHSQVYFMDESQLMDAVGFILTLFMNRIEPNWFDSLHRKIYMQTVSHNSLQPEM